MPQYYLAEQKTHMVDVENFQITRPSQSCERINRAIDRYANHINSKVSSYVVIGIMGTLFLALHCGYTYLSNLL